ncbi:MAG: hypothetical protein HZB12_01470 [Candidatus Yonathbacteria bacterium]|nr:hypothetical protein [Candidatus Yonathbacteria bacterium]
MTNINIAKILAVIVSFVGLLVVFGWVNDIQVLKSILPEWIPMRFITAVIFVFSGIALFYIAEEVDNEEGIAQAVVPLMSTIILAIMGTFLASTALGFKTGLDGFFIKETLSATKVFSPGFPSTGVIISFIIFGSVGMVVTFGLGNIKKYLKISWWIIAIISSVAIVGYAVGVPFMYYDISGFSATMAFHAAILLLFLGYSLVLLGDEVEKSALDRFLYHDPRRSI